MKILERLLKKSNYDVEETRFLLDGFTTGFDIEYQGPWKRQDYSRNIPFLDGVGDKYDLWSKIMKEVEVGRYAGPFLQVPFTYFVQSPIGLVPKAGVKKTRLIFHLSYDFVKFRSINYFTPREKCTVQYNNIDHTVKASLEMILKNGDPEGSIFYSKTDLMSTFRILPLKRKCYKLLILKAKHPETGITMFFIEKNLPFGHSISCSHFQRFSNALRHIFEFTTGEFGSTTNYLDNYLFLSPTQIQYNNRVREFLRICKFIASPRGLGQN